MNINSPVFVPATAPPLVAPPHTNSMNRFSYWPTTTYKNNQIKPANYYQQLAALKLAQLDQMQQMHQKFEYYTQRNFFNRNYQQYQWLKLTQLQQQQQQRQLQQQQQINSLQQQQTIKAQKPTQQQQNVKSKTPKASPDRNFIKNSNGNRNKPNNFKNDSNKSMATNNNMKADKLQTKNDTMQRNGSKASQNSKSFKDSSSQAHNHHQQQQQQHHLKHDSSDSGISTHQQNANSSSSGSSGSNGSNSKTRKSRSSSKRHVQKQRTAYSVDEWLGNDAMYCYDRRFMSSCAEDQPHHNPAHRNSTSSDAAASDDLNSSSSNEDLCSAAYNVIAKVQGKKSASKSRQRRQQKRKQQGLNGQQNTEQQQNDDETPMDIDQDTKENQRPSSVASNNNAKNASNNLRKQCTKAAAIKAATAQNKSCKNTGGNDNNGNALSTSMSSSSVCSNLSGGSSTFSLNSSSSACSSPCNSNPGSPTASPTANKRKADAYKKIARALAPPLRQHTKLNLSECELVQNLRRHIIDQNLLRVYGYPVESAIHEGCVEVYRCLPKPFNAHHQSFQAHKTCTNIINTNDGLFFSYSNATSSIIASTVDGDSLGSDSGQGSGESSPPSIDSDASELGEDETNSGATAFYTPDGSYQIFSQYDQSLEKQCVRCQKSFHVTESGEYLSREQCTFHWGKLNQMYMGNNGMGYFYSCCEADHTSEGCSSNELHVWTGAVVGINGPYTDFVHTPSCYSEEPKPTKVYALDCEMSFTGRGLEVTKVTVVGYDGQLVYEHFVRPDASIVDYNTRFSGITEKDLSNNNSVKTLAQVQRDLLQLIDADTILIGHGLDNDLRVLRLVHKTIIDTSIVFPHNSGFPYKRALKHLTKIYLNRDIQCGSEGHSSFEDSRACLELMLWKVRKEMRQEPTISAH